MDAKTEIETLREGLLEASLRHIPFDGWTDMAMAAGAKDAGLAPAQVARACPKGVADLFDCFSVILNRRMEVALEGHDLESLRIRDRIALAVRLRLEQNTPYREASRRAAGYLMLPQNAGVAARATWRTVDAIWRAIGDRSTDFNFYSKRSLLAGVYVSTFFYWLNDDSEGFADSWEFLDRRIANVLKIPKLRGEVKKRLGALATPLRRFFPGRSGV
ncbi:MAG: COQ9 family protein [Rhodospirillaceae bacterium]|nr:MAG: COQ9 family protein [Rhodospirillaceae bacterium]